MSIELYKAARDIFKFVGPTENIISVGECSTRLRLNLKDKKKVDIGFLRMVEGVLGVVETHEQLQIIFRYNNVNELKNEFIRVAGVK
ncbi:PTS transporter subunit EIIB [Clostridium sp.]|uniref:PTS transporter subunit EIIB n=1 Tax=Clostridium sp. TaxID=1506 RepID=UPI0026184601|nr:PTS transporter subunit EIIB [Clostridium sp.]